MLSLNSKHKIVHNKTLLRLATTNNTKICVLVTQQLTIRYSGMRPE